MAVVLLVDSPSEDVPRALLAGGLNVLSANFARGTASSYGIGDDGSLVITPLDELPARVDVGLDVIDDVVVADATQRLRG